MTFTGSLIGTDPPKTLDAAAKCCGNCEHYDPKAPAKLPSGIGGPQHGFCLAAFPVPLVFRYIPKVVDTLQGPVQILDGIVNSYFPTTMWHMRCGAFKKRKGKPLELAPHPVANGAIEPLPAPSIVGESEPLPGTEDFDFPLPGERAPKLPPETKQ